METILFDPTLWLTDAESQAKLLSAPLVIVDARVICNVISMFIKVSGVADGGNDPDSRLTALLATLDGLGLERRASMRNPVATRRAR